MKRLHPARLLALAVLVWLTACGGQAEDVQQPASATPSPTAAPTSTSPVVRGGDSDDDPGAPVAAVSDPAVVEDGSGAGLIYSVSFAVEPDGFSFRNYGSGYPEGQFTIDELRELFGDGVCSRVEAENDQCIPSPEAQQWITDRNTAMSYGHCIGFTVTSYLFSEGQLTPEEFSRTADEPYDIRRNVPIMREIAANGSLYWIESVYGSEVMGTPSEIIDALIALKEPVDLSIYLPGRAGGHSLLAYGVEEGAAAKYRILTYDSNYPGERTFVEVDYEADTWRYDMGAVNPDVPALLYEGDATTNTLSYLPLTSYDTATCPFCPVDPEAGDGDVDTSTLVSVYGNGEVLIKSTLGRIGSVAGEIIEDLPGARLLFPRNQLAGFGVPDIVMPDNTEFTVEFSGLKRVSTQSRGFAAVVDNLSEAPETNQLVIAGDEQSVAFEAGGDQSPVLNVAVQAAEASYTVSLLGVDFEEGQGVVVSTAPSAPGSTSPAAGLEIRTQDVEISDATLLITRRTDEDEAVFATTDLNITDGGGVNLNVTDWDGEGAIEQFTDDDGDGTYEEQPDDLDNQPIEDVLQETDAADSAIILDTLAPVLPDQGLEAILATLAGKGLTGQEIGTILVRLNLTDEQLVQILAALDLPLEELARLLYAFRPSQDQLDEILAGLDIAGGDAQTLLDLYDDEFLYGEIIADWTFLNSDDTAQLATLINERELAVDELLVLLGRLGLDDLAAETLLGGLALPLSDLEDLAELLGVNAPEPSPTPSPTPADAAALAPALTETPTVTVTATLTETAMPEMTPTEPVVETPTPSATPEPYPGGVPQPTGTPNPYPYPGDEPTATPAPDGYPQPEPTATPDYLSVAFCDGDVLRIIAQEPEWIDVELEVWSSDDLLFTGLLGPEGEPLEVALIGPGSWPDVYIQSPIEPNRVPFGDLTCPAPEPSPTPGE